MNRKRTLPVHPGRVVLEEFLAPRGLSVWHLANDLGVPARRIYEIVQGQRSINADMVHRLAHYFGMSERYWLDLQERYDQLTRKMFLQGSGEKKRLTNSPQIRDTHSNFHNEARKSQP